MGDNADKDRAIRNAKRAMGACDPPLNETSLSRRADVDVKTVRAFLRGQRWPHSDTLAKLDRGLGLPVGTIEGWSEGVEPAVEGVAPQSLSLEGASALELARALLARLESDCATTDPSD